MRTSLRNLKTCLERRHKVKLAFTDEKMLTEMLTEKRRARIQLTTIELCYNERKMFAMFGIRNNHKYSYRIKFYLEPKVRQYFVRYKRDFVITMIVIAEYDSKSLSKA